MGKGVKKGSQEGNRKKQTSPSDTGKLISLVHSKMNRTVTNHHGEKNKKTKHYRTVKENRKRVEKG